MADERQPFWLVKHAEGVALGRALCDMEEQGYEPVHIIHSGMRMIEHPLDNTRAMIPLFTVAGRLRNVMLMRPE